MKTPDIPNNEQDRLDKLHSLEVLDTSYEERFDRLTRMAKRMFQVPISLVSLVDDERQWFKSCMGLDATETPRDISFCGHAILGDEVFVIEDTKADERFADNPLVVGDPKIRFYAGCPLTMHGYKLGTLCLIDQQPRQLEQEDLEILQDLAAMVERELEAIQLATSDELTGISNRRGFVQLAEYSLNVCARQNIPASLIFIDLDKFKSINDNYGHAEGDLVLMTVAEHMKHCFRDSDLFARVGGDEFVILLTNAGKHEAEIAFERFKRSIEKHNQESNRDYEIQFSYGIVQSASVTRDAIHRLMADGDSLMYEVKRVKERFHRQK